jgi:hypothetical protein
MSVAIIADDRFDRLRPIFVRVVAFIIFQGTIAGLAELRLLNHRDAGIPMHADAYIRAAGQTAVDPLALLFDFRGFADPADQLGHRFAAFGSGGAEAPQRGAPLGEGLQFGDFVVAENLVVPDRHHLKWKFVGFFH